MSEKTLNAPHLSAGDLIRYLDHQVDGAERRGAVRHLTGCEACAERLAALGEQSQQAAEYLASYQTDARADDMTRARALAAARRARPARRGWGSGAGIRAAAVLAVLATGAVAVQPVRAWMVDRWEALTGSLQDDAAVAVESARIAESGSPVAFVPVGDVFVLEVVNAQPTGSLTLEMEPGAEEATAQIVNGAGETLLVLPSGVRVENTPGSTAAYRVTLPSNLRLVQVFAGGAPVAMIEVEPGQTSWTRSVPLQRAP